MNSIRSAFPIMLLLAAVGLSGCPEGINLNGTNSITLHNNHDCDIFFLSVVRTGPIDPVTSKTAGVNLLPESVQPGETFRVGDLVDGKYALYVRFYYKDDKNALRTTDRDYTQSIEGGRNYDWYFDYPKAGFDAEAVMEPGAPTLKAILNALFGLQPAD